MTQSVLEGVAFAMRDCLDIARAEEIVVKGSTICGTKVTPLWKQIFSNVMGIPLITTKVPDVTSFGAAMLASVTCGLFPDVAECAHSLVKVQEQMIFPNKKILSLYRGRYDVWHSLYPALHDVYQQIL
jgi:xylulokinase